MKKFILTLAGCALLYGCSGGGSSSSVSTATPAPIPTTTPADSVTRVFVTDNPETEHQQFWTRVFKVEALDDNGGARTLFDDPRGRVFDLKTLRDAQGNRFAFLGQATVEDRTATRLRVHLEDRFVAMPVGSNVGVELRGADDLGRDAQAHVEIEFELPGGLDDNVVVDFDLANFTIAGGTVRPVLRLAAHTGLDDVARHEVEDTAGVVSNLTANSFTLTGNGGSVVVSLSASTVIYAINGAAGATLQNGLPVEVEGRFDTASGRLIAQTVKIEDGAAGEAEAELQGVPGLIDAAAKTFAMTASRADNFQPAASNVQVATTNSTVFLSNAGVSIGAADFFAQLATAGSVEVRGAYDPATNRLTADRVKLDAVEAEAEVEHGVEAPQTPADVPGADDPANHG